MKKAGPKMIEILIESFYQTADEDNSILQGDSRFSNQEFKTTIENATRDVDRLIARLKRRDGLHKIQKIEKLFHLLKERSENELKDLLSTIIPGTQPQAIQVFHRKLNDEKSDVHVEDDNIFLEILNNVDELLAAIENE